MHGQVCKSQSHSDLTKYGKYILVFLEQGWIIEKVEKVIFPQQQSQRHKTERQCRQQYVDWLIKDLYLSFHWQKKKEETALQKKRDDWIEWEGEMRGAGK